MLTEFNKLELSESRLVMQRAAFRGYIW